MSMNETLAQRATGVGTIKDRQILFLEMRCVFDGLCTTNLVVEFLNLLGCESQSLEQIQVRSLGLVCESQSFDAVFAECPNVKCLADFKDGSQRIGDLFQIRIGHALVLEEVGKGALLKCNIQMQRTHYVADDVLDLLVVIAHELETGLKGLIGDFEVTTASEFLELHQ